MKKSSNLKKTLSIATISLFIFSMFFATVPLAFATETPVDLTPDYAKKGATIDILSFDIKGPAGGTTLTSVTVDYTGTSFTDVLYTSIYVSVPPYVTWTTFGWSGWFPTDPQTISGSYTIPEDVTARVKITITLKSTATHGNIVDAKITNYVTSAPPAATSDTPPIDPAGATIIDATNPVVTVVGIPYLFSSGGESTAEWSTEEASSGSYSAKLYNTYETYDYAAVEIHPTTTVTINDLDAFVANFYYYMTSASTGYGPLLELRFTASNWNPATGAGHVDITVNTAESNPTKGSWKDEDVSSTSTVIYFGNTLADGTSFYDNVGTTTLGDAETAIEAADSTSADWVLTRVQVQLGYAILADKESTVYIDDVTIGVVTYELEPLVLRGGDTYDITWIATDSEYGLATNPIDLYYSPDGGTTWVTITTNQVNDGTYTWTLPLIDSDEVLVRVTARDLAGNVGSDVGGPFIIDSTPPTINDLIPADGAVVNTATPTISATLEDALSGIDDTTIVMKLDDVDPPVVDVTADTTYVGTLLSLPFPGTVYEELTAGVWYVSVEVSDLAGNTETAEWSFTVFVYTPEVTTVDVTAFPTLVSADGVDYSTITATVLDQYGYPWIAGKTVYFAITSGTGTLSASSAITDEDGIATVTLTSTTIGTVTVTARADTKTGSVVVEFTEREIALLREIKCEIIAIEDKLDHIFGDADGDGIPDVLDPDISWSLVSIRAAIDAIDVSGIQTLLTTINSKLGTPGTAPLDTVFNALTAIYGKVDTEIDAIKTEIGDISADSGRASWTTLGVALDDIKDEIITIDGIVDNIWSKVGDIYTWLTTDANIVNDSELEDAKNEIIDAMGDITVQVDLIDSKHETDRVTSSASPYIINGLPANSVFRGTITLQIDTALGTGRYLGIEVWDGDSWASVWISASNAAAGTSVSINTAGITDGAGNAIRIVTTATAIRYFDYVFAYQID